MISTSFFVFEEGLFHITAMAESKEAADITRTPSNSDFETGDRLAAFPGDVGYVPENNRESDFFTRNGLNLKSFQRREFVQTASVLLPTQQL